MEDLKGFVPIEKLVEHRVAKNKNLMAIRVDENNAEEIGKQTGVYSMFGKALCVGIMHLVSTPTWMICINPKGKVKKYIFESDRQFENHFKFKEVSDE